MLIFLTGVATKYQEINIRQPVNAIVTSKAQVVIGLHRFNAAVWGGKFGRISKKTWVQLFLSLDNEDDIVDFF